jgi:soluble lytic murein transglycosylase
MKMIKNYGFLSWFLVGLMALQFSSTAVFGDESTNVKYRLHHAKELLGSHYKKSIVKLGEKIKDVHKFVLETVRENLVTDKKSEATKLAKAILKESEKYEFDPIFLMAVIAHESTFDPTILGSHGEIGLMQLKPSTAEWIAKKYDLKWDGEESLKDPVTNVKFGAAYLDYLREKFDSQGRLYLAAYNMGAANVHRALDKQIWPKDYPSKVMQHYIKFYTDLSEKSSIRI